MDPINIPRKRGHKRKKEYTEQEKQDVLQRYQQSTIGKHKFCQQHGIAVSTLYRWLTEGSTETLSEEAPKKQTLAWQPIKPTLSTSGLQLYLSNTLYLKLPPTTDPHWLSTLLSELSRCKFD